MEVVKNYDDHELVEIIKTGKNLDSVIAFLYRSHFDSLRIYIMQNSGNMQDAEDVFQETIVAFIEIVQKNKFREDASVKTFLFSINKNIWFNELKRRSRSVVRETKFENNKELIDADSSNYLVGRETKLQVLDIMNKLGAVCKKLLLAFYYENLSMKEIVETMDYENDQVLRNKKHKCLKQLEQMLTANPILAKTLKEALQYGQ